MTFRFSDIRLKAVIAGALLDNATTLFIMTFLAAALASTGIPEDEIMSRMKSPSGLLLGLIIGLGCTVLGGYLAGRIAKHAEVLQGGVVAVLGMIVALVFREGGEPAWFDIVGFAAMLPAGLAGGYLAQRRRIPS